MREGAKVVPGPAWILNLDPAQAGGIVLVAMPIAVSAMAVAQNTFGWGNPALFIADPGLAIFAVPAGVAALQSLPDGAYWFTGRKAQIILTLLAYGLAAGSEYGGRFRNGLSWNSYKPSDIYHFAMYAPMACVVAVSFFAAWRALQLGTNKWAFWVVLAAIIVWIVCVPFSAPAGPSS